MYVDGSRVIVAVGSASLKRGIQQRRRTTMGGTEYWSQSGFQPKKFKSKPVEYCHPSGSVCPSFGSILHWQSRTPPRNSTRSRGGTSLAEN